MGNMTIIITVKAVGQEERHEKEYEYYKCDYCGQEIVIKKKLEEQDGGIAILPNSITNRGAVKVVMHNKCLNPFLKDIKEEG